MKKTVKILSAVLALVLVLVSLTGCSAVSKKTQYNEYDDHSSLYRYTSTSTQTEFTVPDEYNGKPLTELEAFSIASAEYLKVLNIGKLVEKIDVWAISNCPVLKEINVDEENPNFCSVDGVLYTKDMTTLLKYPNAKSVLDKDENGAVTGGTEVVIPDSVKTIEDNAFYLCSNVYHVTFNEGIERIGNMAFIKCSSLVSIELPSTLKELGEDAFSYCDSLKAVEIPAGVEKVGNYAFFSTASQIEKITVNNSEDAVEFGTDWIPTKAGTVGEKVEVEYKG